MSCYLCGKPIPEKGAERRKSVRAEHVIPECIINLVVPKPAKWWPLLLDVHPDCDARYKAPRDQLAKIIGTTGPAQWSKEEFGLVQRASGMRVEWIGGWQRTPVFQNASEILYVAYLWARGCHAALYAESLPWPSGQWTSAPAPSFSSSSPDPQRDLHEARELTEGLLNGVSSAMREGQVDTVSLLNGAIQYNCVWVNDPDDTNAPWACMWALDLPGAERWSMGTRGRPIPWHGMYASDHKPQFASQLHVRSDDGN